MEDMRGNEIEMPVDRRPEATPRAWLTWSTAAVSLLGVALAAPEWVPRALTKEDGPVEYATFGCFVAGAVAAAAAARGLRPDRRRVLPALALALVLFVAAGEEISWGQRLLGVETPPALVDGNRQDELNLHNVEGLQDKAVIAQVGVALGGLLLAAFTRRPWARVGVPCFAAYLAYRLARAVGAVVGWGDADRNSEAAELILAGGLLLLAVGLWVDGRPAGARRT